MFFIIEGSAHTMSSYWCHSRRRNTDENTGKQTHICACLHTFSSPQKCLHWLIKFPASDSAA